MQTKQDILDAIRETAKQNGNKPLGYGRFRKDTGINEWEWGKHWARWGDALREAGFLPNRLQGAHDQEFLMNKLIGLIRKCKKFPTVREISLARNIDAEFPSKGAFQRLGTQHQLAMKVIEFCRGKDDYADVVELCNLLPKSSQGKSALSSHVSRCVGEVYLLKSGKYYKIGRTNDPVRRGRELRIQLPEKCTLVYSIKTDDPSGVEAYWHKRFEAKRMQGERFGLNPVDVKAFRQWKRIN